MTAKRSRTQTWLLLIGVAIGLLPTAILGLFVYMSATATTPLHPSAQEVTSVTGTPPARQWADAVEQGRHIVRAVLTEQNLPGLSVTVGVGSEMVWAEGFGWADLDKHTRVVGCDGESLGGMVASLMTVPEHGIVVSVTSNISYANTFAVASKIAQAFADENSSPPNNPFR